MNHRSRRVALVSGLAILLSACGNSQPGGSSAQDGGGGRTDAGQSSDAAAADHTVPPPPDGSVAGELGDPDAAPGTGSWGVPPGPAPDDLTQAKCATPRAAETLHTKVTATNGTLDLWVWIPQDVCFVRCALAYFSNSDDGSLVGATDLQYIASRHACAVWSAGIHWSGKWHRPALDGTGAALVEAFNDLASSSSHPELKDVPLAATGMSIDATFITNLALWMPQRTIVTVPLHGGGLTEADVTAGAENVVWAFLTGSADGVLSPQAALENLRIFRSKGAACAVAVQPNIGHDMGQFRGLTFPFMDAAITYRLPARSPTSGTVPLNKLGDTYWLGNNTTLDVFRAADNTQDPVTLSWLPSAFTARRWQMYWQGSLPKTYSP